MTHSCCGRPEPQGTIHIKVPEAQPHAKRTYTKAGSPPEAAIRADRGLYGRGAVLHALRPLPTPIPHKKLRRRASGTLLEKSHICECLPVPGQRGAERREERGVMASDPVEPSGPRPLDHSSPPPGIKKQTHTRDLINPERPTV